jgi:alkylated DNA repair dioxygenase AlkB
MTINNLALNRDIELTQIPGMTYIPNYIDRDEQTQLMQAIDRQPWQFDRDRRLQQHGYQYNYQQGSLVSSKYLGSLPDWADRITQKINRDGLIKSPLDHLVVNEYLPGQGIRSHIDCRNCFGNTIFILSLLSSCVMEFTHHRTGAKVPLLLEARSLVILQGVARYQWLHSVAPRQFDEYQGREFTRSRRVSLTFREALFPHK